MSEIEFIKSMVESNSKDIAKIFKTVDTLSDVLGKQNESLQLLINSQEKEIHNTSQVIKHIASNKWLLMIALTGFFSISVTVSVMLISVVVISPDIGLGILKLLLQ